LTSGGSSGILGETEKEEAESDTSEGAPSAESDLEVSEAIDGDGSGVSKVLLVGETAVVARECS
jgi:hypothetical protein